MSMPILLVIFERGAHHAAGAALVAEARDAPIGRFSLELRHGDPRVRRGFGRGFRFADEPNWPPVGEVSWLFDRPLTQEFERLAEIVQQFEFAPSGFLGDFAPERRFHGLVSGLDRSTRAVNDANAGNRSPLGQTPLAALLCFVP